jgi:hypothetical protein
MQPTRLRVHGLATRGVARGQYKIGKNTEFRSVEWESPVIYSSTEADGERVILDL